MNDPLRGSLIQLFDRQLIGSLVFSAEPSVAALSKPFQRGLSATFSFYSEESFFPKPAPFFFADLILGKLSTSLPGQILSKHYSNINLFKKQYYFDRPARFYFCHRSVTRRSL
jgi:hypothetical protein